VYLFNKMVLLVTRAATQNIHTERWVLNLPVIRTLPFVV
jgi:hypothetical protein